MDDDDDLKLVKASASLLSDLKESLPKLLWKPGKPRRAHRQVRKNDLDHVTKLIEPFQGEPQLLDSSLASIVPPIIEAYLEQLSLPPKDEKNLSLQEAVCIILYTLRKVRGYKVIVGFFNNEPRYLEPVLKALEDASDAKWQVSYVLLLWLSHLLLTPFDLSTISTAKEQDGLPSVAVRCLHVGTHYLPTSTKAQEASAAMLVRLFVRPDMRKLDVSNSFVGQSLQVVKNGNAELSYQNIGHLRLLARVAASPELERFAPGIYRTCAEITETNAVAKKLLVKIFRNITIVALRSTTAGSLTVFFEQNSILEQVIEYLLQSLPDRDTPVRYASAKALGRVVLELDPAMGQEVIQAVLDTYKQDLPRNGASSLDFRTADALRWHGLTLSLSYALFNRTASPSQLPDIIEPLVAALQFNQRSGTGSQLGTNVRDAANFGIWSLARRYTTAELQSVVLPQRKSVTVIQTLAIQLVLSACLDPAGNIRRGSSAALQELVGRHPNQITQGIPLVQVVDYQAVGLRARAMVEVATSVASLDAIYVDPLITAAMQWRGACAPDTSSRESSAKLLCSLGNVEDNLSTALQQHCEIESAHGYLLALAELPSLKSSQWNLLPHLLSLTEPITPRALNADLPVAVARFLTTICSTAGSPSAEQLSHLDILLARLLNRSEASLLNVIPQLARAVKASALRPQTLQFSNLAKPAAAGSALALGVMMPTYENGADALRVLMDCVASPTVEWRVTGLRALGIALSNLHTDTLREELIITLHKALNDYTIDERGDIGSLVRGQALECLGDWRGGGGGFSGGPNGASNGASRRASLQTTKFPPPINADIVRLSLESLPRVRLRAAQTLDPAVEDVASVGYFWGVMERVLSGAVGGARGASVACSGGVGGAFGGVVSGAVGGELNEASGGAFSGAPSQASREVMDMNEAHGTSLHHNPLILSSWEGLSLTAGGNSEPAPAREAIALFLPRLSGEVVARVFITLLAAARRRGDGKKVTALLETVGFILNGTLWSGEGEDGCEGEHRNQNNKGENAEEEGQTIKGPRNPILPSEATLNALFNETQRCHFKSGNLQLLAAAVKVYRGLLGCELALKTREGIVKKLHAMEKIRFARVREFVGDVLLWVEREGLGG